MKINNVSIRAINSYNTQVRPANETKKAATFADKVEISKAAKEMQVPSTYETERADRVQQLKADIQSGEYKVDARKLAKDMLNYYRG